MKAHYRRSWMAGVVFAGATLLAGPPRTAGAAVWAKLVRDIFPGSSSSTPDHLTNVNGTLFFMADDGTHGRELWKSDGTEAGTVLVKDIYPGPAGSSDANRSELIDVNGTLFFVASDARHSQALWKSDGTQAGTILVKDIAPWQYPSQLTNVNGTLFFVAEWFGEGLWKSDGTAAGTIPASARFGWVSNLTDVNGTLFFTTDDGRPALKKTNGTSTTFLRDFARVYTYRFTDVNGTLFFGADDGTHGMELWESDGTQAGTTLVKDIFPGSHSSFDEETTFTNVNGTLFFGADDGMHGQELWKSDGTEAGTTLVKDIFPGSPSANRYLYPTNVYATHRRLPWQSHMSAAAARGEVARSELFFGLFFGADDGTHGQELWKTDGTEAGTTLVKDIFPGSGASFPYPLTNVNGTLFFKAHDGTHGDELWESDGTQAGTVLVKDIYPGPAGSSPANSRSELTDVNGTLFFVADDGTHGTELWRTVPGPNLSERVWRWLEWAIEQPLRPWW
jgi:ELWxxDGT repeat protein